jgi:small subunit ribosomal protein S6
MSNSYEMMYILRPDLLEEQVQQEINKYRDFLSEHKAENIEIKNMGKRRLAYPIKKRQDGVYVQMNYTGDGTQIAPLERAMRLSDEVIRYLTIKLKETKSAEVSESSEAVAEEE